jgi:hypothetical protein
MSGRSGWFWRGLCGLLCIGCGAAAGSGSTPVIVAGSVCSGQPAIAPALALAPQAARSSSLVALVSDGAASELVVYDVTSGRQRFRVPATLQGRPQILQDVVVATDPQGQLLGFDLVSGARRFSARVERPSWLGAVQVGRLVIFTSTSLSFRPGERGSTVTAIDARSGARVWERRVSYALSAPSLAGDTLFLISDHADVWALDARTGSDAGCTRLGEPTDWLTADAGGLLLGAGSARRLPAAESGERLAPPIAQLPGRPALQASGYVAVPASRSAHGRVGVVLGFAARAGAPRLARDQYYFVFYREVFAYRADGQLVWARLLDADVVRAAASAAGLSLLSEDGSLRRLDPASGAELQRVQVLTGRVASADLALAAEPAPNAAAGSAEPSADAADAAQPGFVRGADAAQPGFVRGADAAQPGFVRGADAAQPGFVRGADAAQPAPAPPLRDALLEIALDTDARLLPGRLLALSALAALPEPVVTQDLLRIYTQPGVPSALRERIAKLLQTRQLGTEYLVDALLEDYDFLEDRSPPPLAAIVPALVAAHETRAVPRLVERLFDPDTRLAELEGLVQAIALLGDVGAAEPLARFLAMYHADSALADDPTSLAAAARALYVRAGPTHSALLSTLAQDPATLPALRASLSELQPPPAAEPTPPAAEPTPPAAVAVAKPNQASLPERLSDDALQHAFVAHAEDLRACTLEELARNPNLRSLRLSFVVQSDGGFSDLSVLPDHTELLRCLQGRLATLRFPAFRGPRRLASYNVAVHPNADLALAPPTEAGAERPFWKLSELRAGPAPKLPDQAPWWQDQNPLFVAVDTAPKPAPTAAPETRPQPAPAPAKPVRAAEAKPAENAPEDAWWLPTH